LKRKFFRTPADFRTWLEKNHATAAELWVGFYKKDLSKPSITWPESVDQALCFGWIDGIRKRVGKISLSNSVHSAAARQHLERDKHQARQGARQTETNATGRIKSVRSTDRQQVRHLFLRTTKHGFEAALCKVAEEEQSSLELFRNTAPVVSKNDRLVDYQRRKKKCEWLARLKLISESAKRKRMLQ
jgi:hypothetical protein